MNASDSSTTDHDQDFLTGKLLIAMPNMGDPRFERAVLLVCAHDREHAMGVIINKPVKEIELGELLEQLEIDPRPGVAGEAVFFGGPVQTDRGVIIHTRDYDLPTTLKITPEIGLSATREILADIAEARPENAAPSHYRFAIGYAGWDAGQLEDEIAANAWAHCDADASLVFETAPEDMWQEALHRLGVTEAMFSDAWSAPRDDDAPLN